jgi:hypothetical protein
LVSSISGQCGPGSRVLMAKNNKILTAKNIKFFIYKRQKTAVYLSLGHPKRTSKLQEKHSALKKRTSSPFKT